MKNIASSRNRTRAARVAGEHSTTEPTMLTYQLEEILSKYSLLNMILSSSIFHFSVIDRYTQYDI